MKARILFLMACWLIPAVASGQTYSWNGSISGQWSNAGNWTGGTPISGIDTILNFNNSFNLSTTQDITTSPVPLVVNQLNFGSSAGLFVINGAPIEFRNNMGGNGPIMRNDTDTAMRYNNELILTDTVSLRNANNTLGRHSVYGTITGSGGLTIRGGGLEVLGTANYQGNTVVNNLDGGYGHMVIAAGGVFNGPGSISFDTANFAYLVVNGSINAGGLLTMGTPNNGSGTNRAQLFGTGVIHRDVLLHGTPIYTQGLTINGNLTVSNSLSFIGISNSATVLNVNGNTTFNNSFEMRNVSTLNVSGTSNVTNGTFTIPATATFGGTGTSLVLNSGNGTNVTLLLGTSITRDVTTTVSGNGGVTISNVNQNAAGTINGSLVANNSLTLSGGSNGLTVTGPITTSGSGALSIQNTVTANGLTTINNGITLLVSASLFNGSGALQVNTGGVVSVQNVFMPKSVMTAGTLTTFSNFANAGYSGPVTTTNGAILYGGSATTMFIVNTLAINGNTTVRQAGNDGPVTVSGLMTIHSGLLTLQPGATLNANGGIAITSGVSLSGVINGVTTVQNHGFIRGIGTINGTVTNALTIQPGGILSPGNSPGQIVIGGGLDIGGVLEIEISSGGGNNSTITGNTAPGQGFDTIQVTPPPSQNLPTNAVVRTGTSVVRLRTANANQLAFNGDSFWAKTKKWQVLSTTNGGIELRDQDHNLLGNFYSANVELYDPNGNILLNPLSQYPNSSFGYEILANGNGALLNVVWSPVPEPMSILAISGLGLLGAHRVFRRWVAVVAQDLSNAV